MGKSSDSRRPRAPGSTSGSRSTSTTSRKTSSRTTSTKARSRARRSSRSTKRRNAGGGGSGPTFRATGCEILDRYVAGVLDGTIVVGRLVRLAVERHLKDLELGAARGITFDPRRADHAIRFFRYLRHYKGRWGPNLREGRRLGLRFVLEPWQGFIVGSIFGWVRLEDGTRRFRIVYIEVSKKQGKTLLAAGIGCYMLVADGEAGAEVYTAATKRDQARLIHRDAVQMVKQSPDLRRRIQIRKDNLSVPSTASKYEPLGRDSDSADGPSVSCALIDELHRHKSRAMYDVLRRGMGAREQPLLVAITTAGDNQQSICYERHAHARAILEGSLEHDATFAFIATIDEGDRWDDPATFPKSNPNLGVSVLERDLLEELEEARASPGAQNDFRRLKQNQWINVASRAIDFEAWKRNRGDVSAAELREVLRGRYAFAGLDLADTTDIAALVLVFPFVMRSKRKRRELLEPTYLLLPTFWIPEENLKKRVARDHVPYDEWLRDGWLRATPGNVIDYNQIRRDVRALHEIYPILEIAVDRWNATQIIQQLEDEDGLRTIPHGQGYRDMNAGTKELLRAIEATRIRHGDHPVLAWMAGNLVTQKDDAGNLKPTKAKSINKIDGIVAAIMGIGRAMLNPEGQSSRYDREEVRTLP